MATTTTLISPVMARGQRLRSAAAARLFGWREGSGSGVIEVAALAVYALILALVVPFHEPWGDEVQAWMLARDNSLWGIFRHRLHYEGAPALWHFLIHAAQRMGLPWAGFGWFGACFAVAGIYVLLRWSPFPLALRVMLPFTFFLQYQYAVVTRSYVLFPLLLFALCALYEAGVRRMVWFAVVAGLLANLCMQGAVVAGAFILLYGFDLYRQRALVERARVIMAGVVLAASAAVCVYAAMPAPDVSFAVQGPVSTGMVHKSLVAMLGETPRTTPVSAPDVYPPYPVHAKPAFWPSPKAWLTWQLAVPGEISGLGPGGAAAVYTVLEIASEALWPVSSSNGLGLAFLLALVVWAHRRGGLKYLLPVAALWMTGEVLWVTDHHAGLFLVTLLGSMWVVARRTRPQARSPRLERGFLAVALVVFGLQVVGSAQAVVRDRAGAYDPGRATAKFLQARPGLGRVAAFHFWSESIQPYFARNPFFNLPGTYWIWCTHITPDQDHARTMASHPEMVVYTMERPRAESMRNQILPLTMVPDDAPVDPILLDLRAHGYGETHRFCGERFGPRGASFQVCDVIYEPERR